MEKIQKVYNYLKNYSSILIDNMKNRAKKYPQRKISAADIYTKIKFIP